MVNGEGKGYEEGDRNDIGDIAERVKDGKDG